MAYNIYEKCYVNVKKTTQINVEATFFRNVLKCFQKMLSKHCSTMLIKTL